MIMMAGGEGWLLLPNDFSDDLIVVKEKERERERDDEFFLVNPLMLDDIQNRILWFIFQ